VVEALLAVIVELLTSHFNFRFVSILQRRWESPLILAPKETPQPHPF
jgi:hypothetical protein